MNIYPCLLLKTPQFKRIDRPYFHGLCKFFYLVELAFGHLRYHLTDVPPQSNSPPDGVLGSDGARPHMAALGARSYKSGLANRRGGPTAAA